MKFSTTAVLLAVTLLVLLNFASGEVHINREGRGREGRGGRGGRGRGDRDDSWPRDPKEPRCQYDWDREKWICKD
ncbi:hypothetical protein BKA69DRAFT_299696 [Paraphysoderma sedebokerense]|nr:hypothetical protein BKA69DRAFT_299696 [Paraphysoderma sedebokerense]